NGRRGNFVAYRGTQHPGSKGHTLQMTHRKNRLRTALLFAAATYAIPQAFAEDQRPQAEPTEKTHTSSVVQIVALDECDPATFNAALGPGFCKNVALAALG